MDGTSTLDNLGHDVTVVTYQYDGTDDYDDPLWSVASTTTTTGRITRSTKVERVVDASGNRVTASANGWVREDVTLHDGYGGDQERASEVVDERSGKRYVVVDAFHEGNGLVQLSLRRKRQGGSN